jgi:hypothetical protein
VRAQQQQQQQQVQASTTTATNLATNAPLNNTQAMPQALPTNQNPVLPVHPAPPALPPPPANPSIQQVAAPPPRSRMPFADLPTRHEHLAPCFNNTRSEEVEHYFADLQHLLAMNAVVAEDEMKQATVKYLKSVGTKKLWRMTPTFADAGQTYKDFKTEILSLYPSAGTDCTFSIQDLDLLIGEQAQVGIISTNSVADYYRQFLLILHYLIRTVSPVSTSCKTSCKDSDLSLRST